MSAGIVKCPFCEYHASTEKALHEHLGQYAGTHRIPADGVHDVLLIQEMIHPGFKYWCQYQCLSCSKIYNSRRRYIEHVRTLWHYGHYKRIRFWGWSDADTDTEDPWPLPFGRKVVSIPKKTGMFPFLRLPHDFRHIIYKYVLCFGSITLEQKRGPEILYPSIHDGRNIWFQYDPCWNTLSLLAVNRQIYSEARRIFYAFNSFGFVRKDDIPIFLIGIGQENAELLKSLQWKNRNGTYEERIGVVRSCMTGRETSRKWPEETVNIWNDDGMYKKFLTGLGLSRFDPSRPLRVDAKDIPNKERYRRRYKLQFIFGSVHSSSVASARDGVALFELYG